MNRFRTKLINRNIYDLLKDTNIIAPHQLIGYNGPKALYNEAIYETNLIMIDTIEKELIINIKDKITELHKLNILHGNLFAKNIIVNRNINDIRFINYKYSKLISTITEKDIEFYNYLWGLSSQNLNYELKTIEDLLNFELNIIWSFSY